MNSHIGFPASSLIASSLIVSKTCVDLPLPLSPAIGRRASEPLRRRRRALLLCVGLNLLILLLSFWLIGPVWA